MKTIDELRARQDEIKARQAEIDNEYAGEKLPDDAQVEFDQLDAEYTEIEETIDNLERRRTALEAKAHEAKPAVEIRTPAMSRRVEDIYDLSSIRSSVADPEGAARELRERALIAVDKAVPANEAADEAKSKARLERLLNGEDDGKLARHILVSGSADYQRGFAKTIAGRALMPKEQAALGLGSQGGGLTVPFTLDPTVMLSSDGVTNPLRQLARVESITTDEWRGIVSTGVTVERVAEATEATDKSPTLTQPTCKPGRVQAWIPFSYELSQDWNQLQSEVARMLADGKDVEEAGTFVTGAGDGDPDPQGIVAGLAVGQTVTGGAIGTFTIADLYSLRNALPHRFRSRASFMAEGTIYDKIRQFDTAGGANLWVQLGNGTPPTLLGRPAAESSAMSSAVATGNKILLYGDFSNFLIVDRIGMQVELVPQVFGANQRPTGQRGFYAVWRNTSVILVPNAFRLLKVQ